MRVKRDIAKMKLHRIAARVLSGVALASVIVTASLTSAAAETNIFTLNTQMVFAKSKAGQSLEGQIETLGKALRAEITKAQTSISEEGQKLEQQRGLLKEEDFNKKARAFGQKSADTKRKLEEKGQALQLGANKAQQEIQESLLPVLDQVVAANGGGVLLDKGVVLSGGKDLTAEVIKALDGKITSVKVTPITPK
jgi:Skp family chaperone for outer membrane proteins